MALTWGKIRKYTIDACGEETGIINEVYDHVNEGYRRVCSLVDCPELVLTTTTTVTANTDYVAAPTALYHILTVINLTDEYEMKPEPGGMLGRGRYIQSTGRPPSGSCTHYYPDGLRIYVRDTPTIDTSLQLRYRVNPTPITEADLDASPLTPDRFDWAIIHAATRNYLQAHPSANAFDGETHITLADKAERALQAVLGEPRPAYSEVNKAVYHTMRLSGYNMGVRRR
jgi:hypothetical protein